MNGDDDVGNMILTKFVCKEDEQFQEQLQRERIKFGIADVAVDRLWDLVISQ